MTDAMATHYPVSVKAVLAVDGRYVLLKNERDEWELPGGKLDSGEQVEDCLIRELKEELGVTCEISRPLNNWVYTIAGVDVVIVTYLALTSALPSDLIVSNEHKELKLFRREEVSSLRMPDGYKRSIELST